MDLNFLLTLIQAESLSLARKNLRKSCNWFASAAIIFPANKKHMVLKCARDPMFLEEADEAIWRIEVSKYINFCVIKQSVEPIFL